MSLPIGQRGSNASPPARLLPTTTSQDQSLVLARVGHLGASDELLAVQHRKDVCPYLRFTAGV